MKTPQENHKATINQLASAYPELASIVLAGGEGERHGGNLRGRPGVFVRATSENLEE
jgi:hypothetical protein